MIKGLDNEILNTLRLIRTPRIGNITFFKLINKFKTATNAVENIPKMLEDASYKNTKPFTLCSKEDALKEIEQCYKDNVHIIPYFSENYPSLLTKIEDKPPIIFVKGNVNLLKKKSISIVGSRNSSVNGKQIAENFAYHLSSNGFNIVSGLAKGIDSFAHTAAVEKGTSAVLGCGVNVVYPKENQKLFDEIVEKGVVISEFKCNTKPQASFFPMRNRIITGMSRGVLVVESSAKSGAFITANLAEKQKRAVMALPCSPFNKQSNGNNILIQKGASLVQSYQDVLDIVNKLELNEDGNEIAKSIAFTMQEDRKISNKDREKIQNILSYDPLEVDLIVRESGLDYQSVSTILLEMELCGIVTRYLGNKVSLLVQEEKEKVL